MSVGRLIEFFSVFTKLPVYAEDVRDQIVDMGIQDEILLEPMDAPPGRLMGLFVRYRDIAPPYKQSPNKCIVFYNKNVSPDEQNFICCKELMHVFDNSVLAVDSTDEFNTLVNFLFREQQSTTEPTISGLLDHMAIFHALAVMFPHEIRDDFIEAHNSERMTYENIAAELGVPLYFVPQLMSPEWEGFRKILLRL